MKARLAGSAACVLIAAGSPAAGAGLADLITPDEVEIGLDGAMGVNNRDADRFEFVLRPVWEHRFENGVRYRVSTRLRADAIDDLVPGRPDLSGYAPISRPAALGEAGEFELRDAYLDFDIADMDVRLGKQQIVWGKLYGFKLLDAVNPQSFREFILEDFDQSRIGLWSLNATAPLPDVGLGAWTAQFVWAPDTTVHELPEPGATFELTAPRFRFGAAPDAPLPAVIRRDRSDNLLRDGVFAARIAGFARGLDLAVNVVSGLDPEPLGRLEGQPGAVELVRFHKRRTIIGASAAGGIGRAVFRFEAGYTPDRAVQTRSPADALGFARTDQLGVALAVDISGPFDTLFSFQVYQDTLLDRPRDAVRPRSDTLISAFARRTFLDEKLTAAVQWNAANGASDYVLRPSLRYEANDNAAVALSADIFNGEAEDIFGQFADRDRITFSIEYFF